jgi:hypothetical protein
MKRFATLDSFRWGRLLNSSPLGLRPGDSLARAHARQSVVGQLMQVQRATDAAPAVASLKPLADLANAWRALVAVRIHSYRPEKHYMRGPGPKCLEKNARDGLASQQ